MEIGRKPIDQGNGSFDFKLRLILFNIDNWLELTEEEGINFFPFLRRSALFNEEWKKAYSFRKQHVCLMGPSLSRRIQTKVSIYYSHLVHTSPLQRKVHLEPYSESSRVCSLFNR